MKNLDHARMTSRRLSYVLQQQVHLYTPEANQVRDEIDRYVEAERQIEGELARRRIRASVPGRAQPSSVRPATASRTSSPIGTLGVLAEVVAAAVPRSTVLAAVRSRRARSRSSRLTSAATAARPGRSESVKPMPWSASSAKPQPRKRRGPPRRTSRRTARASRRAVGGSRSGRTRALRRAGAWRRRPIDGRGDCCGRTRGALPSRQPLPRSCSRARVTRHVPGDAAGAPSPTAIGVATLGTASRTAASRGSVPPRAECSAMVPRRGLRTGRPSVHQLVHEVVHRAAVGRARRDAPPDGARRRLPGPSTDRAAPRDATDADAGHRRQLPAAVGAELETRERVRRQQQVAVEVDPVGQPRHGRGGGDAQARLLHAAEEDPEPELPRAPDHAQRRARRHRPWPA